ncbi:MAG: hypothetical protein MUP90_07790 [Gammaproteobacteria bacterium]|nr:hypothetical protein [Gammaproteobacteria bacterium]
MAKTWERFYLATRTLVGPGPIKRRLAEAFEANLEDLSLGELPEPIHNEFKELLNELHSVSPTDGESVVWASVRKMSDRDADRCAEKIVYLYAQVTRPHSAVA